MCAKAGTFVNIVALMYSHRDLLATLVNDGVK